MTSFCDINHTLTSPSIRNLCSEGFVHLESADWEEAIRMLEEGLKVRYAWFNVYLQQKLYEWFCDIIYNH